MHRVISQVLAVFVMLTFAAYALAAGNLPPQTSSRSGVTVKVTPRSAAGTDWEFEIVFDTHSQELKDDPMKSAVLAIDGGATAAPIDWHGDGPGGHHRKGVLRFKVAASPAMLELRLHRPAESEARIFRWQLR